MPGDRQRQPEEGVGVGGADDAGARDHLRQGGAGDVEQVTQLVRPGPLHQVEEQRAAGVGGIGDVRGAAGSRAITYESTVPSSRAPSRTPDHTLRLALGQPGELGPGEVRVQPQPGESATRSSTPSPRSRSQMPVVRRSWRTIAGRGERRVRGSHTTAVSRWSVIPMQVGCASVRRVPPGRRRRSPSRCPRVRAPPSPGGEELRELAVAAGQDVALLAHDQRRHPGRSCIDRQHRHEGEPIGGGGGGGGEARGPGRRLRWAHSAGGGGDVRFFDDTEFIEHGTTIDLVSIGVVDETGREFYAASTQFDLNRAIPWVRRNVLDQLPAAGRQGLAHPERIRDDLLAFLTGPGEEIELWAWFGAYDHVALCQLWGATPALPRPIPRFTRELRQRWDDLAQPALPPKPAGTDDSTRSTPATTSWCRKPRRRPLLAAA